MDESGGHEPSASPSLLPERDITGIAVRPYAPADRPAVRRICCETANRGEPVDGFFDDREVFADLVTRYYTDYEPQATWIAECDGHVIGYLTGCLESRRYWRLMRWQVIPSAVIKAIVHGMLFSPRTWALFHAGMRTALLGGLQRRIPGDRFSAHLHMNLQQGFRGRQVGRRLVESFLRQAAAVGVGGVHASVRGDHSSACRFFERLGFVPLSRHPVTFPQGGALQFRETVVYGKYL